MCVLVICVFLFIVLCIVYIEFVLSVPVLGLLPPGEISIAVNNNNNNNNKGSMGMGEVVPL